MHIDKNAVYKINLTENEARLLAKGLSVFEDFLEESEDIPKDFNISDNYARLILKLFSEMLVDLPSCD